MIAAECAAPRSGAAKLTVDHVLPVTRGGTHDATNLVTLCQAATRRRRGPRRSSDGGGRPGSLCHMLKSLLARLKRLWGSSGKGAEISAEALEQRRAAEQDWDLYGGGPR